MGSSGGMKVYEVEFRDNKAYIDTGLSVDDFAGAVLKQVANTQTSYMTLLYAIQYSGGIALIWLEPNGTVIDSYNPETGELTTAT